MGTWFQYDEQLKAAVKVVSGNALQPTAMATTVRGKDGQAMTSDGPFAETKEQLGGYYLIDVKDLDEALEWAAKMPAMTTASQAAERVFREEYGRVFASLVRTFGDFDTAEEAIQEAFVVAVDRWPSGGLPDNPAVWITTTAKRKAIDGRRRE